VGQIPEHFTGGSSLVGNGGSTQVSVKALAIDLSKGGAIKMANQVGKRYVCKKCGAEFIVTRGGNGELHCCGQAMELKK
jgi:hypothetical protein